MSAMGVMNSFRCGDGRVSTGLPRPIRRGGIAASPKFYGTSNRTKISRAINLDARRIFTGSTTPPPLPWPKFSSDTNADAGSVCAVTNLHVGVTSIGLLSHWLLSHGPFVGEPLVITVMRGTCCCIIVSSQQTNR